MAVRNGWAVVLSEEMGLKVLGFEFLSGYVVDFEVHIGAGLFLVD